MSKYRDIRLLASEGDREALQPLLDALSAKGLRVLQGDGAPKKDETVLAALSARFYADEKAQQQLLDLIGAGAENVLPLQLDAAPMPDTIKNAIYARNIIPAAGRGVGLIAERIAAALPKKKNPLPLVLSAAALVLIAVVGLLLWQKRQPPVVPEETAVPVVATAEPTPEPLPIPAGITEEELAEVRCVAIIGEHFSYFTAQDKRERFGGEGWPDMLHELANEDWDWESRESRWFWHEDGSEVSMTGYDLRFLSLMPNLEELHLAKVIVEQAPDLSGLEHLATFWGYDSELGDLSWVAASTASKVQIRADVDYSPLGQSEYIRVAILDVLSERGADFSGFSPKKLHEFSLICNGGGLVTDLSGLAECKLLRRVVLQAADIRDLSFLEGKGMINWLTLDHLPELRDISALNSLTNLVELSIYNCNAVTDYSPISACRSLKSFYYRTEAEFGLRDASFLAGMPDLNSITLENVDLNNLDFLSSVGSNASIIDFGYAGSVGDFSGLASVKLYGCLSLDPDDGTPFSAIAPYLQDATIRELDLRRFVGLDLSILPYVSTKLILDRCDIRDLSTLREDYRAATLQLERLYNLRSLDGLQNQSAIGRSSGQLFIRECPRLTDWSALEGMSLYQLEVESCFTLPDFDQLSLFVLRLSDIPDLDNVDFAANFTPSHTYSFDFAGLPDLTSLVPLKELNGKLLRIAPQLQEQAEELVQSGKWEKYEIVYPDGGWSVADMEFKLESLDELETLPKAILRRITEVYLVGDEVYDRERFEVNEDWSKQDYRGWPALSLRDRMTDEETPLKPGVLEDLSLFADLTGLKNLELVNQPLRSLDGIQALASLENVSISYCPELSDASPIFTLQELYGLHLRRTGVSSIQGVQNLTNLHWLDLTDSPISDLSPLADCDFSTANADSNGVYLSLNGLDLRDGNIEALGAIAQYGNLSFNDLDPAIWIPLLSGSKVYSINPDRSFVSNENLAAFCAEHPELRFLRLNEDNVTDLTPLLALENLEQLEVSDNMEEARASLDGQDYGFELFVW